MANARYIRAAQVQARGLLFTPGPSGPAASLASVSLGSGATRPYTTTRARQWARGAHTARTLPFVRKLDNEVTFGQNLLSCKALTPWK